MNNFQHGDVLIKEVNRLPEDAKIVARSNGVIVVMAGEVTGHRHLISQKGASLYELKGDLYLEVTKPVVINHEEHKPLWIPTGIYQIGQVKEYDYFEEMERLVVD